jgi:hypothetical protein
MNARLNPSVFQFLDLPAGDGSPLVSGYQAGRATPGWQDQAGQLPELLGTRPAGNRKQLVR